MAQGLTLCNLFEMARENECRNNKPDLIYIFGARDDYENQNNIL